MKKTVALLPTPTFAYPQFIVPVVVGVGIGVEGVDGVCASGAGVAVD